MRLKDVDPHDWLSLEMLLSRLAINLQNRKIFNDQVSKNINEREEMLEELEKLVARSQK